MDDRKFEQSELTKQLTLALARAICWCELADNKGALDETKILLNKIQDEKLDIRLVSREY